MSSFDLDAFSIRLLAEAMFYDEEYGAIVNISLISEAEQKEKYIAYYLTEEQHFVIDKVTDWEAYDPEEEGAIGYALAIDSDEFMSAPSPLVVAEEVLKLAKAENLIPSVSLFFEEEGE